MSKYIVLLIFTLSFTLESEASSKWRRRNQQRNTYLEALTKKCESEKTKLNEINFNCPSDSKKLIKDEYISYLEKNKNYNSCINSNEGQIKDRAYQDVFKTYCMTQAENIHTELVKEIVKNYNEEQSKKQLIFWAIMLGIITSILLLMATLV